MRSGALRILMVEDDDDHFELFMSRIVARIKRWSLSVDRGTTFEEGTALVETGAYDLILLDLSLPDSSPAVTLREGLRRLAKWPVIVMTSLVDHEMGLQAIREGAQDYLDKEGATPEVFVRATEYALERYRLRKELERRNEELRRFAYTLAHEFRSPLTPVSMTLNLLRERVEMPVRLKENLDHAIDSTEYLTRLVSELLAFAKGESAPEGAKVDLDAMIRQGLARLEARADEPIEFEVRGHAPVVEGVGVQLKQLFENLFSNAYRYRSLERPLRVTVIHARVSEGGRAYHQTAIHDNGRGIAPEHWQRVFEPFFRSPMEEDPGGTGLGLSFCRQVAERHGGTIHAESSPEGGASFVVRLPALAEE